MRRYQPSDGLFALFCVSLALGSLAFGWTNGLVAEWDDVTGPYYCHQYNSTGGDDDLMICVGVVPFGICLLSVGWLPGKMVALGKAVAYTLAWVVQLGALGWIEVGSLSLTVLKDGNLILGFWLALYVFSLPAVWWLAVRQALRANADQDRNLEPDSKGATNALIGGKQ